MPRARKNAKGEIVNNGAERSRLGEDRSRVSPRIVRADVLQRYKALACSISKDLYTEFRIQLYRHGLSASESIAEFASCVAKQDPEALKILERLAQRKVREKLVKERGKEKLLQQQRAARTRVSLEEVDHDALYGLIEQRKSVGDEG